MEMSVSEIRRMYSQSKDKWIELSILADLNDCSVEQIAEIVADIPVESEIAGKRVNGIATGERFVYHRDFDEREEFYKNFSTRLKSAIDKKGISNKELARRSNVSRSAISFYVNSERLPDILSLMKICKELNVSADELLGINNGANI